MVALCPDFHAKKYAELSCGKPGYEATAAHGTWSTRLSHSTEFMADTDLY